MRADVNFAKDNAYGLDAIIGGSRKSCFYRRATYACKAVLLSAGRVVSILLREWHRAVQAALCLNR